MKPTNRSRRRFALALLPAALFTTISLTASAAQVPKADRWVSMAFSFSTQEYYGAWSSDVYKAVNGALDRCNLYQSDNKYDCVSAGVAKNGWLAVALGRPKGGWGSAAASTASVAGTEALRRCKGSQDKDCRVVFNHHSSEH